MKNLTVPMCAVCKKPVDRFEQSYSVLKHCHTFVAECHGERQEAMLSDLDMMTAGPDGIQVEEAFNLKAIAP